MKNLTRISIVLLLLFSINLNAQTTTFDWVKKMPFDFLFGQATDNDNNIYVTGNFYDTIQIGSNTIISNGESDVIIVKYNSSGSVLWYKAFGGVAHDDGFDIKVDSNNDVIITVMSNFPLVIEDDTITSPSEGAHNSVIIKLSSSGEYIWGIIPGYNEYNCFHTYNSVVDHNNNVFTGGNFYQGNGVFPDTTTSYNYDSYNFVTKYDSNGEYQWVKIFEDNIVEFDVDYLGNLLLITSDYNSPFTNIIVQKYNSNGNGLWSKQLGIAMPSIPDIRKNLGFDYNNNFYLTACLQDTILIDNETFISNGENDILLLKFSSQGELVWGHNIGGPNSDNFCGLHVKNNVISLVGVFKRAIYFNEGSLVYHDRIGQVFIAQFNTDGNLVLKKQFGGENVIRPDIISYDESIYLSGYASDSAVFDNVFFDGGGTFLARIDGITSISKHSNLSLNIEVYPNPFTNSINIGSESNFEGIVELFTLQGVKISEYKISQPLNTIYLKSLPAGNYFLKFVNDKSSIVKKIIKI